MTEDTYRGQANDPLSLNLYTYCHNDPIMYKDSTGHWEEGDEFLIDSTKNKIKRYTDLWFKTNDPSKKAMYHSYAQAIRNDHNNYIKYDSDNLPTNNVYKTTFDKKINNALKDDVITVSEWTKIRGAEYDNAVVPGEENKPVSVDVPTNNTGVSTGTKKGTDEVDSKTDSDYYNEAIDALSAASASQNFLDIYVFENWAIRDKTSNYTEGKIFWRDQYGILNTYIFPGSFQDFLDAVEFITATTTAVEISEAISSIIDGGRKIIIKVLKGSADDILKYTADDIAKNTVDDIVVNYVDDTAKVASNATIEIKDGVRYINGNKAVINVEKQARHLPDTVQGTRSYLTTDAKRLLDEVGGTGDFVQSYKEVVDVGRIVGKYVDQATGMAYDTTRVTIHYSKTGVHIVPAVPLK